ncbi:hypothetical protein [Tropicibacter sp. Alg240-R139]|uniref:hypothetical protein n=1 Tax=Tropicibacter sp. Alg240-R139 TaxID=2305991 RepID=UPI0013E04A3C|nr:hypothetical protein [Tropicibacter sp. Alg240-R139]
MSDYLTKQEAAKFVDDTVEAMRLQQAQLNELREAVMMISRTNAETVKAMTRVSKRLQALEMFCLPQKEDHPTHH